MGVLVKGGAGGGYGCKRGDGGGGSGHERGGSGRERVILLSLSS